jgi:cysteine synthase A
MIYQNILKTIGNTPVIKINRLAPNNINMYVKVESFNPMSSVKDRLALAIIEDAERKGDLKPGQTVIEATSGNTGIALAMVCAVKGYPFVAVMSETFSIERRKLMRALGAKVILTPAAARGTGMVKLAEELSSQNGWFLPRQFENPANPAYHLNTTASEILLDFKDQSLDYFVSGYGTGGTISGVGKGLKLARPHIKIIGAEPQGAQMLAKNEWAPHKIQGWIPDFIPKNLAKDIIDEIIPVDDTVARDTALMLAQKEGIFCGISAGATFAAAIEVANQAKPGATILAMLPDTGERYMSTFLFENINEGSD